MNLEEGHLGGYIRSRYSATPTEYAFEHGDPETFYPDLWRWAVERLEVESVLDVGCGEGHAAHYFRELGCRVLGVDGSVQAQRDSRIPDQHVRHDYSKGPFLPPGEFDLVWSCEFVEHIEERFLDHFFQSFRAARRFLMITYALPGQPGHHHVNCQPEPYWVEHIEALGFELDLGRTHQARWLADRGHFGRRGLFFAR